MNTPDDAGPGGPPPALSPTGRYVVLGAAFLGWMFAGLEMGTFNLAARPAVRHFLGEALTGEALEAQVGKWFSWYICAFLMGAACGGLLFGSMGDRTGRARAMAASILCYSILTGMCWFARSLEELLALRFLACFGIGGMWPNGVALVSEAWPDASRPLLAGLIGTAANVGLAAMGAVGRLRSVTPEDWRWVMLVGVTPVVLGLLALYLVPESPRWLAGRRMRTTSNGPAPASVVFRPPYLGLTIIGICLGTIPLLGGWGSTNWLIPWADRAAGPDALADTQFMRSAGAAVGSLLGGWMASLFGRRATYFVVSLASLAVSQYIFRHLDPSQSTFLNWTFAIGFISTIYFGWLPLYLPELFPTAVRATGTGVTFNFGRIVTAAGTLGTGGLMVAFAGDYARVGQVTSLVFALGMVVILFAPDTTGRRMEE